MEQQVNFVTLAVEDVDRSRAFYVDGLGWEPATGLAPITLAHNVTSPGEVDDVLRDAAAAGADVSPGEGREWGGYSGYFADPDGYRWEVAHNPSPLGDSLVEASRQWLATQRAGSGHHSDVPRP